MKIFVTGGAGFIGSAVIRLAIKLGHSVVNVDSLTYASCLDNIKSVSNSPNYKFENIDIRNLNDLNDVFMSYRPDAVMHLAAETHVDRSIDNPVKFINTNILGTMNLLEASRLYKKSLNCSPSFRFLHVSTDEVYGSLPNDSELKFTEKSPYNPRSPYAASKASADHLVKSWYETYGLPIVLTNCSNNYGPFSFPVKLIPVTIINALRDQPLPIYGDGSHIRDWLFVDDHAKALFLVLEMGELGQNYNIGGNNEMTNLELVKMLCSILDKLKPKLNGKQYSDQIEFVSDRPGHDKRYAIDSSLIKNELGWTPSVDLKTGLEKTVKWYVDNKKWWEKLINREGFVRLGTKI